MTTLEILAAFMLGCVFQLFAERSKRMGRKRRRVAEIKAALDAVHGHGSQVSYGMPGLSVASGPAQSSPENSETEAQPRTSLPRGRRSFMAIRDRLQDQAWRESGEAREARVVRAHKEL